MRSGKKRIWEKLWIGSVIAAFVSALGIYAVMIQTERKILSDFEREYVYVAGKELPRGQILTEENYADYLVIKEVEKTLVPKTALRSPEQILGLMPKGRIEEGVLLTTGMFEKMSDVLGRMEQPVIAGFKAEDLYQVTGGVLRAGDHIHIYTVSESGQAGLIWKDVFVEQVFDNAGSVIADGEDTAAQRINVYLDEKDVERFYTELARGTLRVVKVCEK